MNTRLKEESIHQRMITLLGNIKINKNIIVPNITGTNFMSSLTSETKPN